MKKEIIIVVGPPCCGGGELIKLALKRMKGRAETFSTGSRFREIEDDVNHEHHKEVKRLMPDGFYVSDETTIDVFQKMFFKKIGRLKNYQQLWFDKNARTGVQSSSIIPTIINAWRPDVVSIISIDTPLSICKERMLERAKKEGRLDDTEESLENRLMEWERHHEDLFDSLCHHGKIYRFQSTEMRDRDAPLILDQLDISEAEKDGYQKAEKGGYGTEKGQLAQAS